MTELDKLLDNVKVPDIRASLKSDILKAARAQRPSRDTAEPANDNKWGWVGGLAACFLFVAIAAGAFIQSPSPETMETEQWAEAAEAIGYGDLYDWVNEEEIDAEDDIQFN